MAWWICRALMFGRAVLDEFNRLMRDGLPVPDLPEVEKPSPMPSLRLWLSRTRDTGQAQTARMHGMPNIVPE